MNQDIAQEIIILRAKHGWTQQMLAEKLGTTQRTIAAWESGVSSPREDHARAHRPGLRTTGELLFRASGGGACSRADRKDHQTNRRRALRVRAIWHRGGQAEDTETLPRGAFRISRRRTRPEKIKDENGEKTWQSSELTLATTILSLASFRISTPAPAWAVRSTTCCPAACRMASPACSTIPRR